MSLSLYEVTIPPFRQMVDSVQGVLEKGAAHVREKGRGPDDLLALRLYDDMLPMTFQLHSVMHHSIGAIEGVKAGEFAPPANLEDLDFAGYQARLADSSDRLAALSPDEVNAVAGKDVIFRLGKHEMPFTAEGFLLSFSKPNLYFHATTAYDLLRKEGVPLGKRDYMGRMQLKA